jgi:hypothetical protein
MRPLIPGGFYAGTLIAGENDSWKHLCGIGSMTAFAEIWQDFWGK